MKLAPLTDYKEHDLLKTSPLLGSMTCSQVPSPVTQFKEHDLLYLHSSWKQEINPKINSNIYWHIVQLGQS